MLELVDLFIFKVIVALELGVASSHRVGGFQQIIAEETVTGLDEACILCSKFTGLMLFPNKASVLGDRSLGLETVDVFETVDELAYADLDELTAFVSKSGHGRFHRSWAVRGRIL